MISSSVSVEQSNWPLALLVLHDYSEPDAERHKTTNYPFINNFLSISKRVVTKDSLIASWLFYNNLVFLCPLK